MNYLAENLRILSDLPGFKITSNSSGLTGGIIIEASGHVYDGRGVPIEEAVHMATIHILAHVRASEMLENIPDLQKALWGKL